MNIVIPLPGLRAETLLGFTAALGTLRLVAGVLPTAKLVWLPLGGGWSALLHLPDGALANSEEVVDLVFKQIEASGSPHPILHWERFLGKAFTDEGEFYRASVLASLLSPFPPDAAFAAVFSSQKAVRQIDTIEHFDHPFRAARKDYYLGNLESVLKNTGREHIARTLIRPWDYRDAMANQSLRLDHGDDRRHAYQWHAPTEDPARQKSGCMLGANRLAIEAFPLFPCVPVSSGNTAIGFTCESKSRTWVSWPIWTRPCSLAVVSSLLNLALVHEQEPQVAVLSRLGIVAVLKSRRLPVEKNKIFLPPESIAV